MNFLLLCILLLTVSTKMEGYQKLFVTNKKVTKNGGDYKGGLLYQTGIRV